jgi:hypothetical protein
VELMTRNGSALFTPDSAPLTNLGRRLIGNLPQPRNVAEIAQSLDHDQHAPTLSQEDVNTALNTLAGQGWVVNLGAFDSPAKAAAATQKSKAARSMHDEHAEKFAARLSTAPHLWRTEGDLWMFTEAGFEKLHEAGDEPPPMTPSQVQAAIDAEWARTHHEVPRDAEGRLQVSLVNNLLEDEFSHWAKLVADDCEGRWNVRPVLPMAGGQQYSDFYENLLLDAENQKTALGAVADPWHMALTTVAVTDVMTGSTITEANYTGYARKTVAGTDMPAASGAGGSTANTSAIIFAACTALTSTVIGFAHCVALTVGNVRKFGTCASTVVSTTQTPAQFAIGAYTTTVA